MYIPPHRTVCASLASYCVGRSIPKWKLSTGEPCAGKSHARFGGRGGREPFSTPLSGENGTGLRLRHFLNRNVDEGSSIRSRGLRIRFAISSAGCAFSSRMAICRSLRFNPARRAMVSTTPRVAASTSGLGSNTLVSTAGAFAFGSSGGRRWCQSVAC